MLFDRRTSLGWTLVGFLFSGLLLLGAVGALIGALIGGLAKRDPGAIVAAVLIGGFGALILFLTIMARARRFSCHLRGVRQTGLFGERRLRFDELEAFTLAAVRIYVKGAYAGTQVTLTFEPLPARNARKIKYAARVQNVDESLELLREHVSNVIAARSRPLVEERPKLLESSTVSCPSRLIATSPAYRGSNRSA